MGNGDAFVSKFSSTGELLYSTYLEGKGWDSTNAMTVDGVGNVWIAGTTVSETFPVTKNAWQKKHGGNGFADVFLAKFSPWGNLLYATLLGGRGDDGGHAITVDKKGNIWVTGRAFSGDFPVKNAWQKKTG